MSKAPLQTKLKRRSRPGPGRPTPEQAERRHAELLDRALALFLDLGYEQTTIDAIAESLGMTKRTIYARYSDKTTLFQAAVQRAIDRSVLSDEDLRSFETDDLEETLMGVVRALVRQATSPEALKIHRLVNAEFHRCPGIFPTAYEGGAKSIVAFLSDLLRRHEAIGEVCVQHPETAAYALLSMVVGGPVRRAVSGGQFKDPNGLEDYIAFGVTLFLNGVRTRTPYIQKSPANNLVR
jgi:AcrR family transcriptional regulator